MRRVSSFFVSLLLLLSLTTFPANAQTKNWNDIVSGCVIDTTVTDGSGNTRTEQVATLACLPAVFQNIVYAALMFAGAIATFFIVYAGIKYITSSGDPKQVEGARHTLTYAIIGLIVVFISFFILNIISGLTGVGCILKFGFDCT